MPCKIKFPIIPTAYDADLSDEEKIILLMAQVQEAADELAIYSEASPEWIEEYVYSVLFPLKQQLTELSLSCDARFSSADTAIYTMVNDVNNYVSALMLYTYTLCNDYTDEMSDRVNAVLDHIVLEDVLLRNVITGEMDTVQTIVNDLAGLHQNGPTAGSFDARSLTCSEFEALNLNAFSFDFTGL